MSQNGNRIILAGSLPPRLAKGVGDQERVDILNKPITRIEYSQAIAPFTNACNQHEAILSYILERGLTVSLEPEGMRARIDLNDMRAWGIAKGHLQPDPEVPPEEAATEEKTKEPLPS